MTGFSVAQLSDPFLTPATLAMSLWPTGFDRWTPEKHLVYASHRITNTIMRGNGRLCISMPPRHGKTRLVTETLIPWFLEKFPGRHVMLISYNQEMADEVGGKAKDMIQTREDLFAYRIRHDRARVEQFETDRGSIVRFSGINTGQTGKGAHLIIIDDYIKGIDQAFSPTERENMWLKFLANIYTRMEPGCTLIIMATRWHSDDLIGRITTKTKDLDAADKFEYICFPAICEDVEDVLGRKKGDALFPSRFPVSRLNTIKALNTGGVIFESLYQQHPIDTLSVFANSTWLKILPSTHELLDPMRMNLCRAWDFAATQDAGDFTCGTLAGRIGLGRQMFVKNVIKKKLSPFKIEELIRRTAVADGTDVTVLLEVEPGSQGTALVEHYQRNVLKEFDVVACPAGNRSKLVKAQPFLASAESGNVYLEESAWNADYAENFGKFPPASGHGDEDVDTSAMCYNHLFTIDLSAPVWGRAAKHDTAEGTMSYKDPSLDALFAKDSGIGSAVSTGLVWGRRSGIRRSQIRRM